jgi:hypothetical protein
VKAEIGEQHPQGLLVQLVVKPEAGGLRHIFVWESKEDWDHFQTNHVEPAVNKVLSDMGIASPRPPAPAVEEMVLIDFATNA